MENKLEKLSSVVATVKKKDEALISKIKDAAEILGYFVSKSKDNMYIYPPSEEDKSKAASKENALKKRVAGKLFNKDKVKLMISNETGYENYNEIDGLTAKDRKFFSQGSISDKGLRQHLTRLLRKSPFEIKGTSGFHDVVMKGTKKFDFNQYDKFIKLFKKHKACWTSTKLVDCIIKWRKNDYSIDSYSSMYDVNCFSVPEGVFVVYLDCEHRFDK